MSHSHHGGSFTTTGTFKEKNRELAEAYWYLVAGAVGLAAVTHAIDYVQVVSRRRNCQKECTLFPARPAGPLSQIWATTTALAREMSYPRLYVPLHHLSWASPPPVGRSLVLLAYWAVIVYMMAAGSVVRDAYFWERIAFRNAWVSATQVPLVYMLAMKINPVGLIIGASHERLNWLHRWVARTLFITATVHGFHFWTQWVRADFVELELEMMPSVKYGLGAWGVLLWSSVTSFYPLRSLVYEVFVLQHLVSVVVLLWLLYMHLPPVALYNLWLAVACIAFDRLARWLLLVSRNLKLTAGKAPCHGHRRIGHDALVRTRGKGTTVVTVRDVHFRWRPGQHLYLWMPALGPLEAHPYTIACAHRIQGECVCNSVELVVRKHAGFSRRLHAATQRAQKAGKVLRTTAFVSGPYGNPPRWDAYDTVVLISASTGASFTLPILEDIVRSRSKTCLKRVEFVLTAREGEEVGFYESRVREALARGVDSDIGLCAHVATTGSSESAAASANASGSTSSIERKQNVALPVEPRWSAKTHLDAVAGIEILHRYSCRLDLASLIRGPVEAAKGETLVVVCGGKALVSGVRNCVAALSDERAVHKGTGAQGIRLHIEEYSF